jgi:hypothetical protein
MQYPVEIEGFEGQSIEIKAPGFLSGPKLLVDGQPAPKGPKRNQMLLRHSSGTEMVASWKPRLLGLDVPSLVVEDQTISVVDSLKWHEWLWCALPMLLIFGGGAIGASIGFIGLYINIKLFRSSLQGAAKYLVTGAVFVASFIIYGILAVLIAMAIG